MRQLPASDNIRQQLSTGSASPEWSQDYGHSREESSWANADSGWGMPAFKAAEEEAGERRDHALQHGWAGQQAWGSCSGLSGGPMARQTAGIQP